jgi:membrane-associated protein
MPPESALAGWLLSYGYIAAYPLAIVEGPVLMMIAGFLVRLELLSFWPIYLVLIAGDLTGDIIWYAVGHHGARNLIEKYGYILSITEENVEKAERFFHNHQTKILFISKITMGLGFAIATLIAAGAARVPFKKYLTINFFGEFIWAGILIAIGYFLGHLYTLVDKSLRVAFVIAMLVLAGLALYGFGKFMRAKLKKTIETT